MQLIIELQVTKRRSEWDSLVVVDSLTVDYHGH